MLTQRELNRALLARQMLLVRARMPIEPAVRHLVGLQAQRPGPTAHRAVVQAGRSPHMRTSTT